MFEPLVIVGHKLLGSDNARIRKIARTISEPIAFAEFKLSVAGEVLRMYKRQSYLEKRMYTKKSILDVAPVFLKKKGGLKQYCCYIFLP